MADNLELIQLQIDDRKIKQQIIEIGRLLDNLVNQKRVITVEADTTKAKTQLSALERQLKNLESFTIKLDADDSGVRATLRELENDIKSFPDISTQVRVDIGQAQRDIESLDTQLNGLQNQTVIVNADVTAGISNIDQLNDAISGVEDVTVKILADAEQATKEINDTVRRVKDVEKVEIEIDANEKPALDDITRVRNELSEIGNVQATLAVDVSRALNNIEQVANDINSLDDRTLTILADVDSFTRNIDSILDDLGVLELELNRLPDVSSSVTVNTADAIQKITDLKTRIESLRDVRIDVNVETATAISNINDLDAALNRLDSSIDIDLDADPSAALRSIDRVDGALDDIRDKEIDLKVDNSQALSSVDELNDKLEDISSPQLDIGTNQAESQIASFASFTTGALGALGVGAAIAGIGSLINRGAELRTELNQIRAQSNLTEEEFNNLRDSAENLFTAGIGEDVTENIQALTTATKQLGEVTDETGNIIREGLNPEQVEEFTKGIGALAQVYELDLNETIQKSRTFVQNFGLEGEEAAELFALGLRDAGNQADDFQDTLSEYSQLVQQAGFSAEEFVNVLTTGIQLGTRDTDKLADAIKETQIRLQADDFRNAFKAISENADSATKDVISNLTQLGNEAQAGAISIADFLRLSSQEIEQAFAEGDINDSIRAQLQVAIAGTQAEDIGTELFGQIFGAPIDENEITKNAEDALNNALTAVEPQGFAGLQRQLQVALDELANGVLTAVQPLLDVLTNDVAPLISEIFASIQPILASFTGAIANALSALTNSVLPVIKELFDALSPVLENLVQALEPVISLVGDVLGRALQSALILLEPFIDAFGQLTEIFGESFEQIEPLVNALLDELQPVFQDLADIIADLLPIFIELFRSVFPIAINQIKLIVSVLGTFVNIVQIVLSAITGLISLFDDLVSAIFGVDSAADLFVGAFDLLNTVLASTIGVVGDVISGIGDLVKGVGEFFGLIEEETKKAPFTKTIDQVQDYVNTIEDAKDSTEGFSDSTEKAGNAAEKTGKQLPVATMNNFGESTEIAAKSIEDLTKELTALSLAGKRNTDEFNDLLNQIVKAKQDQEEFNEELENTNRLINQIVNQNEIEVNFDLKQEFLDKLNNLTVDVTPVITNDEIEQAFESTSREVQGQVNDFSQAYQDELKFLADFEKQLRFDVIDETTRRALEARNAELDNELRILDLQARLGEISFEDSQKKRNEIFKEQEENRVQLAEESAAEIDAINKALTISLTQLVQDNNDAIAASYEKNIELLKEFNKDAGNELVTLGDSFNILLNTLEENAGLIAQNFGAVLGSLLAQGQNFFEAFGKAAAITILDTVDLAVNALIAQIFAQGAAALPFGLGVPGALALIATVKALLAFARSRIGADSGAVDIDNRYNTKASSRDTIPIWVRKGESILTPEVTKEHKGLLSHLLAGGSEDAYFMTKYSGKNNYNAVNMIRYNSMDLSPVVSSIDNLASKQDITNSKLDSATLVRSERIFNVKQTKRDRRDFSRATWR